MSDWRTEYWTEALELSLEHHGVVLDPEVIRNIAADLAISAANESTASGSWNAPNPMIAHREEAERRRQQEIADAEERERVFRHKIAQMLGGRVRERDIVIHNGEVVVSSR